MRDRERLVCVHKLNDPIEANLLCGLLMNEGIPVEITGEGLVGAYSGVPKLCEVRLLVPPGFRIAAELFLRRYQDRRNELARWTLTIERSPNRTLCSVPGIESTAFLSNSNRTSRRTPVLHPRST